MKKIHLSIFLFIVSSDCFSHKVLESAILAVVSDAYQGQVCAPINEKALATQNELRNILNSDLPDDFHHDLMGNLLDISAVANDAFRIKRLLEAGIKQSEEFGVWVVRYGSSETLKLALESGFNPNLTEEGMQNSLIEAAIIGDIEKVKILLENGVKIDYRSSNGASALTWANACGHTEIIYFLRAYGAK